MSWVTPLVDLILPPACLSCGTWTRRRPDGRERRICLGCLGRLHPPAFPCCPRCQAPLPARRPNTSGLLSCAECLEWPEALVRGRWAWRQEGVARSLIHALKYGGWPELASEMAQTMLPHLEAFALDPEAPLVPIPTTAERLRQRGYNQAHCLAEALGEQTRRSVLPILLRTRSGPSQVALPRDARLANVEGVFSLELRTDPAGGTPEQVPHTLVLVDDVLTTGATAAEATRVLMSGGAERVFLLTFARALPETSEESQARMPPEALLHTSVSR